MRWWLACAPCSLRKKQQPPLSFTFAYCFKNFVGSRILMLIQLLLIALGLLWCNFSWGNMNKHLFITDGFPIKDQRNSIRKDTSLSLWTIMVYCNYLQKYEWEAIYRGITIKPTPAWMMTHKSCILRNLCRTYRQFRFVYCFYNLSGGTLWILWLSEFLKFHEFLELPKLSKFS